MKKTRQDQPNPISLSSKRHSLQQDKLTVVQKSDWNTPLQTMDSNHNKTFFSTMKAELSNIRSDYERLIQREDKNATLGLREKEIIEQKAAWGTADKQKSYSSYKQEQRYLTEKKSEFDAAVKNKEGQEQTIKGFNLTKNFSEAVNFKNKHITAREREPYTSNNPVGKYISLQVKEEEVKELNYSSNYNSQNPKKYSTNFNEPTNDKELLLQRIENQRQKEFSAKLQQEIAIYKVDSTRSKAEMARLSEQNSKLKERVAVLVAEMAAKTEKIKIDDENIAKYRGAAEKAENSEKLLAAKERELVELQECMKQEREERGKEANFYGQKINELTFYNNNFFKDNSQLTEENHQLKEVIVSLQKLNEDSKRLSGQSEQDWQRKMDHLQKNLKEYEKRELMFEKEIERLCQQINAHQEESSLESMPKQPQRDHSNQYLEEQVHSLRTELTKQQEINTLLVKKYKEQIQKMNIQAITSNLEQTIQQLSDQNGQLKNECNLLSSKIKSLEEQNHAYCVQIQLYEGRDKFTQANRSLTTSEWEEMTQKIQQLTSKIQQLTAENRRMAEDIDYKQLLQEVLTQQKSFNVALDAKDEFESILRTVKDQLDEIQKLRFQVEKLQIKLRACQEERQDLRMQKIRLEEEVKAFISCQATSETSKLMTKYEQLRASFEQRQRALREIKQFVRQNLGGRTNDTQLY